MVHLVDHLVALYNFGSFAEGRLCPVLVVFAGIVTFEVIHSRERGLKIGYLRKNLMVIVGVENTVVGISEVEIVEVVGPVENRGTVEIEARDKKIAETGNVAEKETVEEMVASVFEGSSALVT